MKSGSHLLRITMQSIRKAEGPLCQDTGACTCLHIVCLCECVDTAGGKTDNAKEDCSFVQYVISRGMLGYTVKLNMST